MRWTTVSQAVAASTTMAHGRPPHGAKIEAGRDEHHALGARAQADVALQSERLGAGARVRDEERADHRCDGDHDGPVLTVA